MQIEYVGGPLDGKIESVTERQYEIYKLTNSIVENGHKYKFMKSAENKILFIYCMPAMKD